MSRTRPLALRGILDRFEGHRGVILFEDEELLGPLSGQELVLPARLLPAGVKQGDALVFEVLTDEQATQERDAVARAVLEDILNGK